jgi:hypothetical protein
MWSKERRKNNFDRFPVSSWAIDLVQYRSNEIASFDTLHRPEPKLNPRHVYREAVAQHSPGSRSAPWDSIGPQVRPTLKGLDNVSLTLSNPFRVGKEDYLPHSPRVRCATLGCVVQPLRGKNEEERNTFIEVILAHSLTVCDTAFLFKPRPRIPRLFRLSGATDNSTSQVTTSLPPLPTAEINAAARQEVTIPARLVAGT